MTNRDVAELIVEALGGAENIVSATNCMTRMRVTVKDPAKVHRETLQTPAEILGLMEDGTYFQVVLGPGKAQKVTDIAIRGYGLERDANTLGDWQANKADVKAAQRTGVIRQGLKVIANIFIPLIPAIIASGLCMGLASAIGQFAAPENTMLTGLVTFFTLIGKAFLGYLVIFAGINAARQFGATEAYGGMIGAISIAPQIVDLSTMMGLYNKDIPLESILTTGKGGIIGVIVGVWIVAKIEQALRNVIPDVLDLVLTPLLTLLITTAIYVFAVMPLAGFISDGLVAGLSLIINSTNPIVSVLSGYILAALFLPMVLFGLHHGLIPIYAVQLESMGGVSLFPVLAMAGAGQVGAAIAIWLKARKLGNTRLTRVITGALPAGILGVGEPLIYGVTLPMLKPFITAGLGAGFGGAYIMLMHVTANAWGPSGLVATAIMKPEHMLNYVIGILISYIAGFIITALVIKDDDVLAVA